MFIIDWWNTLSTAVQVFYCIAIPSTLLLLIQTILMFVGIGDNGDADIDTDASVDDLGGNEIDIDPDDPSEFLGVDGIKIFTLRGLIAFFVVFGWMGVVLLGGRVALPVTVIISAICGFAMMVLLAYLFKAILKLRSDGNTDNRNAVGTAGKVHLTIPPNRSGEGKVHLMLQGAYVERSAVTDSDEAIPTGTEIIVVGISGQTDLVVRKK